MNDNIDKLIIKIDKIYQYMTKYNITENEFCERCSIPHHSISFLLNRDYNIPILYLIRIANVLQVDIKDLFV